MVNAESLRRLSDTMALTGPGEQDVTNELSVLQRMLPLKHAGVLELGCGAADKTRLMAERTDVAHITAVEIDPIAHQKNLAIDDLAKVTFKSYGAQSMPEDDAAFDVVIMFKSLHHVPEECMGEALAEICRVLKPGGYAYFSEPVFAGAFNEVMRVFHDEEAVRVNAFDALRNAVESGEMVLSEEYFFKNIIRLQSWQQYEQGILNVTHTEHHLSAEQLAEVKRRFDANGNDNGEFVFEIPNRVDLLQKL